MDSSSIELPGSEIGKIALDHGILTIHFSRAYIFKTMTGSVERTKWWQEGNLIVDEAEVEGELPAGPLTLVGGDVVENVFTYRDMIPIPLESRGAVSCDFAFEGTERRLVARGEGIRLSMIGVPKYLEHLRADKPK